VRPAHHDIVYIDFQGGSHGNFLEFVCNRFLANITTREPHPFNSFNAAHAKTYLADPVFRCSHYTEFGVVLTDQTVVTIWIEPDDLLPLQCISLLRAGDRNIRPDELEHDTYHKLHNRDYQWVLDNLTDSFFRSQHLVDGYNAIADASWPRIKNVRDYESLPFTIRNECETVHGIEIYQLDAQHPHCPRKILKEFFRIGFADPHNHGFMQRQRQHIHQHCRMHRFPFAALYDTQRFVQELQQLADFCNMASPHHWHDVEVLHAAFLDRQPYRLAKSRCDALAQQILHDPGFAVPDLDVIQEAYLEAQLESLRGST
jgi:hypothetical protein